MSKVLMSLPVGERVGIAFSGGLQVGTNANLTGSADASFGPNGTLLSLVGQFLMSGLLSVLSLVGKSFLSRLLSVLFLPFR